MAIILGPVKAYSQDLIAHYDFNNRLTDQSGFGNHGRLIGNLNMVPDRYGRPCSAMYFDGGTYIEVPTSPSLESPNSALTMAVWFQLPNSIVQPKWLTVVCKGNMTEEAASSPHYRLQVQQNTNNIVSVCSPLVEAPSSTISMSTGFTRCDPAFITYAFQPLKWTFFVLVYDGAFVRCYSQGKLVFQEPHTEMLISNQESLFIGMDAPGQTEFFSGAMDDIRLYNRALSEVEINNLYLSQGQGTAANIEIESLQNMQRSADPGTCGVRVEFKDPQTSSECGEMVTVRQLAGPLSGSVFPIGRTRVEFEAKSSSGKTARSGFYVYVRDESPPQLDIPSDETFEMETTDTAFRLSFQNPKAADPCGIQTLVQTSGPRSGQMLRPGKYRQAFQATDVNGNRTEKSREITVIEKAKPIPVATRTPVANPVTSQLKTPNHDSTKPVNIGKPPINLVRPTDTALIAKKKEDFSRRSIEIGKEIEVESDSIALYLYDNGIIDDDIVSLYLNGELLLSNKRISDTAYVIRFGIDTLQDNILSLFAENLGSIPPNTAYLVIDDGIGRQELELTSTERKNGSLVIRQRFRKR